MESFGRVKRRERAASRLVGSRIIPLTLSGGANRLNWQPMTIANLMQRAGEARRAGRNADARALLEEVIGTHPHHAAALNSLGLIALSDGDAPQALRFFQRAAAADPAAPPVFNLAEAQRASGDAAGEMAASTRPSPSIPICSPRCSARRRRSNAPAAWRKARRSIGRSSRRPRPTPMFPSRSVLRWLMAGR
jgi:predicted Zn-dependent protease